MQHKTIENPDDLKAALIQLFPDIEAEFYDENIDIGYEIPLTFHRVWMDFAPVSHDQITSVSVRILKQFASLVNNEFEKGGEHKNAVSTCLLEHASQVSVKKTLKPLLSKSAKSELR